MQAWIYESRTFSMSPIDDAETLVQLIAFGTLALFLMTVIGVAIFGRSLWAEPERWEDFSPYNRAAPPLQNAARIAQDARSGPTQPE
jgi:hypothetical protein